MSEPKSKYWLDLVAEEIIERFPNEEVIKVSSGHSPSGTYHIGTFREMGTASALAWAVRQKGRKAEHIDFVDDFDVLRKIPAGLPESLRTELGRPLYLSKSPKEGVNYADYYYSELEEEARTTGLLADKTFFARTTYGEEHRYTGAISKALAQIDKAKSIIEEVSHRRLPEDWAPVQILSDSQRLNEWQYAGHDLDRQVINYKTADNEEGEVSFAEGRVKLDWRLDWPARWWIWGVNVEPFGRDHASKGGSYDTGRELVKHIFGGEAPMPVPYEFILPVGGSKKFSKSAGGVLTASDALEVMPPEILRYFLVRSRPEKQLIFDPGTGLFNLIDEFAAAQHEPDHSFKDAFKFAVENQKKHLISSVSFKHLVQVYQAAQRNHNEALEILSRTGYEREAKEQKDIIEREFEFVENWLNKYAPEEVKFEVQQELPAATLTDGQRGFLKILATTIDDYDGDIDGQVMHTMIYEAKEQADIGPREAFQSLYRLILGKDSGPKAGWFLASLDKEWLVKRLGLKD